MMNKRALIAAVVLWAAGLQSACKKDKPPDPPSEIQAFSCDSAEKVLMVDRVSADPAVFAEGKGSLKATTEIPMTLNLFEVSYPGAEKATLLYKAKLKTQDFGGQAYLEMLVHFPNGGEFFSRDFPHSVGGTTDWTSVEAPFILQAGQRPDRVTLNLVMDGIGTVWIDDIHLIKVPM